MDIGLDGSLDFAPYDLVDVMKALRKHKIGSELGVDDHHLDDVKGIVG